MVTQRVHKTTFRFYCLVRRVAAGHFRPFPARVGVRHLRRKFPVINSRVFDAAGRRNQAEHESREPQDLAIAAGLRCPPGVSQGNLEVD